MKITIHEFSTGINFAILDNNQWVSKGFTGSYMNSTLEEIPKNIERAISNNLFKVSESKSTSEPAIIGRVVRGDQDNPDYSVIAIVSKGKDDEGRNPSFYRYFICEGADSLWKIIDYLEQFKHKNLPLPSFNPSHTRNIGPGITFDLQEEKPLFDLENDYPQDTVPILIEEKLEIKQLNLLAEYKAQEHNFPISWAYNVEALENPQQFIIIIPASAKAYQGIKQELILKASQITHNPDFDAQGLKSAIKGLINSTQVKPEWLEAINQSLASEEITDKYWDKLFNDEGAEKAIKDDITSPQIARLLTLRAIILPKAFPDFWLWYSTKKNVQQESLDLQNKLIKPLIKNNPQLTEKLLKDVKNFIHFSLNRKNKLDSFAEFITNKNCAWGTVVKLLGQEIEQDLNKIAQNAKNLNCDFNKDLLKSSLSKADLRRYQDLAGFLEKLEISKPAAYYYQISIDKVPKSLFQAIFPRRLKADYAGIILYREITPLERIGNFLIKNQGIIMIGTVFILLTAIALLSGKRWGEKTGIEQGRLLGQKEVCNKLQEKQKEIAELKPNIQLDVCKNTKEKIEPPKAPKSNLQYKI